MATFSSATISSNQDVSGELQKEKAREKIALYLIYALSTVLLLTLVIGGALVWMDKLTLENIATLILAVSNPFSALLGMAITYYFTSNSK